MRLPRSLLHRADRVPICEVRKCGENLHLIDKEKFPEINGIHIGKCPCVNESIEISLGNSIIHVVESSDSFLNGELAHTHKISTDHVNCICFRREEQIKYSPYVYSEVFWHEYAHTKVNITKQDAMDAFVYKKYKNLNHLAHGREWSELMKEFGFAPTINTSNIQDMLIAYGVRSLAELWLRKPPEEPVENSR